MFEQYTYIGYNVLFCVPFLVLIWSRKEFYDILKTRLKPIFLATFVLTFYGSLIWPLALELRCWEYGDGKITGIQLLNFVYLDDVVWWFLVNFLIVTYVCLSTHYEKSGVDICWRELKGLLGSFRFAFRGLRIINLERNSTVHLAVATFVLIEAVLFQVTTMEWLFVCVSISMVLGFEIFNSCLERVSSWPQGAREHMAEVLGRRVSDRRDREIGLIKDAAASGVLISSIAAAFVGLLIFSKRFWSGMF